MAQQRGYQIVEEYTDRISGAKARRPGLDALMRDARRGRFDVVLVWASDRIGRSVKRFLDVLDELNRLNIEFISFREQIDTGGPLGRAVVVIIGAIAELERNLIVERVRAGMRRAKLEGRHIGRKPLVLDRPTRAQGPRLNHPGEVRMKENTICILTYMLLVAAFAFMIGWVCASRSADVKMQSNNSPSSLPTFLVPAPEQRHSSVSSKNYAAS
jgi:DNA invertase Pin-like site-specific DNA recombinase